MRRWSYALQNLFCFAVANCDSLFEECAGPLTSSFGQAIERLLAPVYAQSRLVAFLMSLQGQEKGGGQEICNCGCSAGRVFLLLLQDGEPHSSSAATDGVGSGVEGSAWYLL